MFECCRHSLYQPMVVSPGSPNTCSTPCSSSILRMTWAPFIRLLAAISNVLPRGWIEMGKQTSKNAELCQTSTEHPWQAGSLCLLELTCGAHCDQVLIRGRYIGWTVWHQPTMRHRLDSMEQSGNLDKRQ